MFSPITTADKLPSFADIRTGYNQVIAYFIIQKIEVENHFDFYFILLFLLRIQTEPLPFARVRTF